MYISFLCIQRLYLFPCTDKTIFWEPNECLASIKGPYMPPYNCIPGSTLITFVVYIAVRLLYAYRVFNVFKQLKHPPINQSKDRPLDLFMQSEKTVGLHLVHHICQCWGFYTSTNWKTTFASRDVLLCVFFLTIL